MMDHRTSQLLARLNSRRQELGMSYSALAHRCGVSEPTLKRVLGAGAGQTAFSTVVAIADALGMSLRLDEVEADALRRRQARKKAAAAARLVQGTSALESQAVDKGTYRRLVERTVHELLAGPRRRLWSV